jgi:Zn-dependent M28 family amino/carboxypeptidase
LLSIACLAAAEIAAGCGGADSDFRSAQLKVNEGDLERHVIELSSDEFEGRRPFTPGERKTVEYISAEFEKMGLEGPLDGRYFQDVPLVEITASVPAPVSVATPAGRIGLEFPADVIVSSPRVVENIDIRDSEMIFAGYGVVAPEYNWNDYEGLDVRGKTVLVLVNDPGYAAGDESLFNGRAMTYYGRWTYKYEEAARQGAEGVIVVHETGAAGYPWTVLQNGAAGPSLVLQTADRNLSRCALEGWITTDAARKICAAAGGDFDALAASASQRDFDPAPIGASISVSITQRLRFDVSRNVMGVLRGSQRPDECVVFTSHWDHFGVGPAVDGDSIYNGAADNALPLSCMLETAKAFSRLRHRPARSVLFIAVTAEEAGLLGSEYYVTHPLFPITKTVAALNYELFLPLGRMKDVTVYGYGKSELDDYVAAAASAQGRYVTPDPSPENGMYYRTDHFSFAKAGVPSLFVKGWSESAAQGREWTRERIDAYLAQRYHTPDDEYDPGTADLAGVIDDAKLFFRIGYDLANGGDLPGWREGSEFKQVRDASMSR